ncbi:MAG: ferritin family protein [bacterium]
MNLSKRKLLEMAIYQEIATRDFYLQVSQRIQDRGGKKKFLDLSEEEEKHRETISQWHEKETGQPFQPDSELIKPVFQFPEGSIFSQSTALEAVSVGIQLERESANFYASWKEREEEPELKSVLQKLIEFENSHYLRLKEEYEAISKNFYWI